MKESLTEQNFLDAADYLGCEVNAIKAVCQVEAPKGGFDAKDRPVILFEPYIFSDLTKGKFDGKFVKIKDIAYPLSLNRRKKPWSVANAKYGLSSIQHDKLEAAKLLDEEAALMACSWGKFQILGTNYKLAGFNTVKEYTDAMYISEKEHLKAFTNFIKNTKLDDELKNKDWFRFAYQYNGPRQDKGTSDKSDDYSTYIEKAYKKLTKSV